MTETGRPPRQRHLDLALQVLKVARADGLSAGDRLPEQLFASRCNVSRTPIRKVFQILEGQGLAEADSEGGYRLAVDPATVTEDGPPLPAGEEDRLYESVLRDLAARRIAEAQTVAGLQRRYGVSRQIVQNALKRLLEEQFVERAAGQQWIFKPAGLTPESQNQSFEFRMILEPAALLAPGFHADPVALSSLRESMERLAAADAAAFDLALFDRTDRDFHALVARSCGNAFIEEALTAHHRRRRTGMGSGMGGGGANVFRLMQSNREHLRILVEIERGDLDLAADLMRVHLRLSKVERPKVVGRGVPVPLRVVGR